MTYLLSRFVTVVVLAIVMIVHIALSEDVVVSQQPLWDKYFCWNKKN